MDVRIIRTLLVLELVSYRIIGHAIVRLNNVTSPSHPGMDVLRLSAGEDS